MEKICPPSFEELQGNDVSYACYTNADRNLISDNIFATILEKRHPKEHETFEIPEQTIIIKGNFSHYKANEPKSVHIINLFKVNVEMTTYKVEMINIS